jgi:uncharacterized protein
MNEVYRRQAVADRGSRFGHLIERADKVDFPYYNGIPVTLSVKQWILVLTAVVGSFLVLLFLPQPNSIIALIPRILFVTIQLGVLLLVAKKNWSAIFQQVRRSDLLAIIVFGLLNITVSFLLGAVVSRLFGTNVNPVEAVIGKRSVLDTIFLYLGTGIQIVGEEVFTILPFLAVMSLLFSKGKMSRKATILVAWLFSAVWFGAAHLPTYDWNVAQAFIIIGGARLVLTLAFIRTKNVWVCSGAHILNDWFIFTCVLLGSSIH